MLRPENPADHRSAAGATTGRSVAMGFYFSPRGGSAQVARYLCRSLEHTGWAPTLFTGSLGSGLDTGNAAGFFTDLASHTLDYSASHAWWTEGIDPMSHHRPIHASYEDKPDVPDRIFFSLDDGAFQRQVASWRRHLSTPNGRAAAGVPDVVHLHHLTPVHEAARSIWPVTPIVTHLHGTELKMLALARARGGERHRWTKPWVRRMQRWADDSTRLIVVSEQDAALAEALLPVPADQIRVVGNGVDTEVFRPQHRTPGDRLAAWRRWLVDEPRGWAPGEVEGSIRYDASDLAAFTGDDGLPVPVVLFAGRFMSFKRLSLLIEAHHRTRTIDGIRSVLVVVGGFPGEWEGEHPLDTVRRLGAEDVFFAGWRSHADLADFLGCADVFAAPSVDEPFGLVYLEAMAAGVPPIATDSGGPATFINTDRGAPTGWLVRPDDVDDTAAALRSAVSDGGARRLRGARAAAFVRDHYCWSVSAAAVAEIYDEVSDVSTRGVA